MFRFALIALLAAATPALSWGQSSGKFKSPDLLDILPLLDAGRPEALSGVLRGAMLKYMPNPLFEDKPGWGNQRMVRRIRWEKRGIFRQPRVVRVPQNDGTWRSIRLTTNNLPNTLILDIRNVRFPEPSRMTFELFLSFDARAEITQQNWERGIRLWSGTVRARFRSKLHLHCEATTRLEPNQKSIFPDAIFRMRATKSHLSYDNLVYEHVPGIGGSAARVLGKTFHGAANRLNPDLESRMFAKANAAIVRAADTREVRLSLRRVFSKMLERR